MKLKYSYVSSVQDNIVVVIISSKIDKAVLQALGGKRSLLSSKWHIKCDDDEQLADCFTKLRDENIAFVGGSHSWTPAEVFIYLRDKNIISGSFKEITWSDPGNFHIREL